MYRNGHLLIWLHSQSVMKEVFQKVFLWERDLSYLGNLLQFTFKNLPWSQSYILKIFAVCKFGVIHQLLVKISHKTFSYDLILLSTNIREYSEV